MATTTENTETPAIEFDKAKAILKVAYLLASVDGVICEEEQKRFIELMKMLFGKRYADVEVMDYLEGVAEDARKLIGLRAFYKSDDEIVRAFCSKAAESVSAIAPDANVLRQAFAIWISICLADNDYSAIEKKAVKGIQSMVNPNVWKKLFGPKWYAGFGLAAAGAVAAAALPVAAAIAGVGVLTANPNAGITDEFLDEVEKRLLKIGTAYAKLAAAKDAISKENYQDMYDLQVESLKSFLVLKK